MYYIIYLYSYSHEDYNLHKYIGMGCITFMFKFTGETWLRTIFICSFELHCCHFLFLFLTIKLFIWVTIVTTEQNFTFMISTSDYYNIYLSKISYLSGTKVYNFKLNTLLQFIINLLLFFKYFDLCFFKTKFLLITNKT